MQIRNLLSRASTWLAYVLTLAVIEQTFGDFFSGTDGVGHDYAFFLPALLDGYYWYLSNGVYPPQWFSPAFCAGIPVFADPQSLFYSPLQFLTFVLHPLAAVHAYLLLYISLGYLGMYLLCRYLGISRPGAIMAAVLWMLNGFITHRVLIGHLSFVGIALIPLIAYLVLIRPASRHKRILAILAASSLIASWVYSGLGVMLIPAGLAVWALLCLAILCGHPARYCYANALASCLVGAALSASKLVAVASLMQVLPRTQYPLMGIASPIDLVLVNIASIIMPSAWIQDFAWSRISNPAIYLDIHEWALTLGPAPAVLAFTAILFTMGRKPFGAGTQTPKGWKWRAHLATLSALIATPLLLQFYTPEWNNILKSLPLVKSTSNTFRWSVLWLPLLCALAAFALDRLASNGQSRSFIATLACVCTALFVWTEPNDYYFNQGYDPSPINQAFAQARQPGFSPRISTLAAHIKDNEVVILPNRNDLIASGLSQAFCYNPLFGYQLENFDSRDLGPGSLNRDLGGHLNMKNPVCYVYPQENQCTPGDHYRHDQRAQAEQVMHYRPVTFSRPLRQRLADGLSLGTWGLGLILAIYASLHLFHRKMTIRSNK